MSSPKKRANWCGRDVMWKRCRTQKLLQSMEAGKKNLFQQWQEMSPLTNDSNGQRRQYPDPKKSVSLHLKA